MYNYKKSSYAAMQNFSAIRIISPIKRVAVPQYGYSLQYGTLGFSTKFRIADR
jgi:hypothetical protein